MIPFLNMEEEKLRRLTEEIKRIETEYGVSILLFLSKEDRDRATADIVFARKMQPALLNAVVPSSGRM